MSANSVIVVNNIPIKLPIKKVVKTLFSTIRSAFEILKCQTAHRPGPGSGTTKYAYVKLGDKVDRMTVMNKIVQETSFGAYIPTRLPDDLPLKGSKRGKIPVKTLQRNFMPLPGVPPEKVVINTLEEILKEMQYKYSGLYTLSKKTGHKLLNNIAQTIYHRLRNIVNANPDVADTGFKCSKKYRSMHPHFGDFQLLLSTLHALEDAEGAPRSQIQESELMETSAEPYLIDNVPYISVKKACSKYSDKIVATISKHVKNLKTEIQQGDSEEEVARKKVREQLKNLSPYLPTIIKQVISEHFVPQKTTVKLRIYGEPFLPAKEYLQPFLKQHRMSHALRSDRMYNLLGINVSPHGYSGLVAMDGTTVCGAKLNIRPSEVPIYKLPTTQIDIIKASFAFEPPQPSEHLCIDEWSADA